MSHYIERLSAYIEVMSPHGVIFQIYRDFSNPQEERRFKAEHERFAYSGIIAMDCLAGQSLVRLKHQIVLESPAIILGYKELLPMPLPKNVIGFFSPDVSTEIFQLLRKISPKSTKILIAGKRRVFEHVTMAKNLINRLQEARLEVGCIYLDDLHHSIQDQITAHASGASLMYTVFDLAVFAHISDIVQIAHQHGIPVVASTFIQFMLMLILLLAFLKQRCFVR